MRGQRLKGNRPPHKPHDQAVQEVLTLIESLIPAGVPILPQEQLELVGFDLEREQESSEHVADSVG